MKVYANVKQFAESKSPYWKNGDLLFVNTSSGLKGTAVFLDDNWNINYKGTIADTETCELYYFENATEQDLQHTKLNENSIIYYTSNAVLHNLGDEIIVKGTLSPLSARLRFKGNGGTKISLFGLRYFDEYDLTSNRLSTSILEDCVLTSEAEYTPYLYAAFTETPQTITLNANKCVFSRTLTEKELTKGQSGFFVVPTKSEPHGWELISDNSITYLVLSSENATMLSDGSSSTFDIMCDGDWSVSVSDPWLHVTPISGEGDAKISITGEANPYDYSRSSTISVQAGKYEKTIDIIQNRRSYLTTDNLTFISKGGSTSINIVSDINWTVQSTETWLTLGQKSGKGNAQIMVTASPNTTSNPRNAIIKVTFEGLERNVSITQNGGSSITIDDYDSDQAYSQKRKK